MQSLPQQKLLLFLLSSVLATQKPTNPSSRRESKKKSDEKIFDVEDAMDLMAEKAREESTPSEIKDPRPLQAKWNLFFDQKGKSTANMSELDYLRSLKDLGSFNTIPQFWSCWTQMQNELAQNDGKKEVNFRLFKDGIVPSWEDPVNKRGGKFTLIPQKEQSTEEMTKNWLSLVISIIIGEFGFDNEICGVVLSLRPWGSILSVWNANANDKNKIQSISQKLKDILHANVRYQPHQQIIRRNAKKSDSESSSDEEAGKKRILKKSHLATLFAPESNIATTVAIAPREYSRLPVVQETVKRTEVSKFEVTASEVVPKFNLSLPESPVEAVAPVVEEKEVAPIVQEVVEEAKEIVSEDSQDSHDEETSAAAELKKKKRNLRKKKNNKKKAQAVEAVAPAPVAAPAPQPTPVIQVAPKVVEKRNDVRSACMSIGTFALVSAASIVSAVAMYISY